MLNFSPEKLLLVGMIALVVLGPNRLPKAARSLGRLVSQLRQMSSSFQDEVRGALSEPGEAMSSAFGEWRAPANPAATVREAISSAFTAPPPSSPAQTPTYPAPTEVSAGLDRTGVPVPDDPSLN